MMQHYKDPRFMDIRVSFGASRSTAQARRFQPEEKDDGRPTDETKSLVESVKSAAVFSVAKQGVMATIGRVGSYTGNYLLQNNINSVLTITSLIGSIATMNPAIIASQALQLSFAETDRQVNIQKANIQSQVLMELSGNSATKRSRGGGRYV